MKTILAADMHLRPGCMNEQNIKLEKFLEQSIGSDRLILLGDTFNCWYENNGTFAGDYKEVISIFSQAIKSGLEISMLAGNRDFAFSNGKITPSGFKYAPFQLLFSKNESSLSDIGMNLEGWSLEFVQDGIKYHCAHGDLYCTLDTWHQLLRYLIMGNPARFFSSFIPAFAVDALFFILGTYKRNARTNNRVIANKWLMQDEALVPIIDSGVGHVLCGHLHQYLAREVVGDRNRGQLTVLPCWAGGEYGVLEDSRVIIKNITSS